MDAYVYYRERIEESRNNIELLMIQRDIREIKRLDVITLDEYNALDKMICCMSMLRERERE